LKFNEVLIAAKHLEKSDSRVHLFEARHEWMLRQETYKVTLYRETQGHVVHEDVRFTPDGFLDFRLTIGNQTQQACILVELDMDYGHASETALSEKDCNVREFYQRGLV
jgi:hypothetical protein